MNQKQLYDTAYSIAREQLEAANLEISKRLTSNFPTEEFDAVFQAARRGRQLYVSSLSFAEKVWSGSLAFDKALDFLKTQFSDFPETTVEKAFSEAYTATR
jgi:hypothetical protein